MVARQDFFRVGWPNKKERNQKTEGKWKRAGIAQKVTLISVFLFSFDD